MHIGDPLLLEVAQLFLHALEASGEQPRVHGDPQHFARPEPLRVRLPLFVQPAQALAAPAVGPGHHGLQPFQHLPVMVQLHIKPVQLVPAGGQAALKSVHSSASSTVQAIRRRTSPASGIERKAPFRVVTR